LHYAIVGMPTRGEDIRRLAAELGVAERVHLLGRLDDARLVRVLNAADLFAMTSRHTADGDFEGYGIAVVEAALCGLPSVVSSGSGLSEAVVDGQTGLCVPQEDPCATAAAMRELMEDTERRRAMGQAARRRAEAEQTWDRRMPIYDALLREVARR
jgi:phosphatidylinositol alpha-1,6-mannosyltransferase